VYNVRYIVHCIIPILQYSVYLLATHHIITQNRTIYSNEKFITRALAKYTKYTLKDIQYTHGVGVHAIQ